MNTRDFKFWLHGFFEIGSQKKFTKNQIDIIRDHIAIVEQPDDFIIWLKGAIDVSIIFKKQTSERFYENVGQMLDVFFEKKTPDRKEQLAPEDIPAKDDLSLERDKLNQILEDIEKGVPPRRVVTPFVVGPVPVTCIPGRDTAEKPDRFSTEVICRSLE
jgi:hypothetical protein